LWKFVFAARFPDNRTNAATKYCDIIAVAFLLVYMFLNTYPIVPMFTARPIPDYPDWMFWAFSTSAAFLILFALCWKVARTKIRVISVWAASRLTSSVGVGIAMFVALLAGMTLRSLRTSVVRFVDRVFLRRRHEAAVSLDALRDTLRGSNDAGRLTDEVATTLGLSSLAVFSRAADGGFVRNAAYGWPPGSAWRLLPEEALTRTLDDDGSAIVRVPDDEDDLALPADDARPRFALAVRRGDRVERASLDRDAMRSLHGVFDEAIFA
jgi:hypothetical protein